MTQICIICLIAPTVCSPTEKDPHEIHLSLAPKFLQQGVVQPSVTGVTDNSDDPSWNI